MYAHTRRANIVKKVRSPTYQEPIISKSLYEIELTRFTIHIANIEKMSWTDGNS